jgi:predicted nucleic acid-binding protein
VPYLIDSDQVIPYLADEPAAVTLIGELAPEGISISVISYMEVYQGLLRVGPQHEAWARFNEFSHAIRILPVTQDVAIRCAILRETLHQQGRRVHPRSLDLLIAATAIEHGLVLVTRNVADYADLPGLMLYHH